MTFIDIIGSTLLGATVIVAIMGLNLLLSDSSRQVGSDLNVQENTVEFTKSIQWDFAKIGYRDTTGAPILVAKQDSVVFLGDIDNSGSVDTVRYYKGLPEELTWTPNPNDFLLMKEVGNASQTMQMNIGLTKFQLTYFDSTGGVTADPKLVRGLKIAAVVQSPYATVDSVYSGAYWENTIYPRNLNVSK